MQYTSHKKFCEGKQAHVEMEASKTNQTIQMGINDTTTLSHHPYILCHFAATYANMLCVSCEGDAVHYECELYSALVLLYTQYSAVYSIPCHFIQQQPHSQAFLASNFKSLKVKLEAELKHLERRQAFQCMHCAQLEQNAYRYIYQYTIYIYIYIKTIWPLSSQVQGWLQLVLADFKR